MLHGKAAGRRRALRDDEHEARDRDTDEAAHIAAAHARRQPDGREAALDCTDDLDTVRRCVGRGRDRDEQHDGDDGSGDLGRKPLESQDDHDGGGTERERRPRQLGDLLDPRNLLVDPRARSLGHTEDVGDLAREHLDADTGEEADEYRRAQEVTEETELEQTSDDQDSAGDERDRGAVGHPLGRVGLQSRDAEPGEPGGQERSGGRVGADHEQLRGAEQRDHERREDDRVETRDERRLRAGSAGTRTPSAGR